MSVVSEHRLRRRVDRTARRDQASKPRHAMLSTGGWPRPTVRGRIAGVGLLLVLLLPALATLGPGRVSAAGAHPTPGGYDPLDDPSPVFTTVDRYDPPTRALVVNAYGSLAHFDVEGRAGHQVVILGYEQDPYLRIDGNGATFENMSSPAHFINGDTAGAGSIPAGTTEPNWVQTGSTFHVQWHDHRIHWMEATPPTTSEGSDVIQGWEIQMIVDGTPTKVTGALHRDPAVGWDHYAIGVGGPQVAPVEPPTAWWRAPLLVVGLLTVMLGAGTLVWIRSRARRPRPRLRPSKR